MFTISTAHLWAWSDATDTYVCPTCGDSSLCTDAHGGPSADDPGMMGGE